MAERGPIQLDIGIVVSSVGGNSSQDRNQFHGLFSLFGIGLLIGHNGFLAGKLGIHFKRTFGLAILIPIVPIYGATGASFLSMLPIPQGAKVAAAIPLLLAPAAFAYQEEFRRLLGVIRRFK